MSDDYWLVTVDRRTGVSTTLQIADKDTAYQEALDVESLDENLAAFVVRRKVVR